MEREGYDRTNLTMPGLQTQLVQAIVATGTPTVVVLINSGGLAASWIYDNVPAVIEAYYPGELGGDAMASLLLGDVSPAGRLVTTIYPAAYVAERNITDMELRAHAHPTDAGAPEIPGATYRFYPESRALFPFGYGRSYTTFRFGWNGPSYVCRSPVWPLGVAGTWATASGTGTVFSRSSIGCWCPHWTAGWLFMHPWTRMHLHPVAPSLSLFSRIPPTSATPSPDTRVGFRTAPGTSPPTTPRRPSPPTMQVPRSRGSYRPSTSASPTRAAGCRTCPCYASFPPRRRRHP